MKAQNKGLTNNVDVNSFGVNNFVNSRSGYATLVQRKTFTSNGKTFEVVLNFADNEIVTINKPTKRTGLNGIIRGYMFQAANRQKHSGKSANTPFNPVIFSIEFYNLDAYNQFISDINSKLKY